MDTLLAIFISTSTHFSLPPGLLAAVCTVESGRNPAAVHYNDGGDNSIGLCQIKLKTARWLGFKGTERELMIPSINIYYAGKYLAKQRSRYHTIHQAVIAYNYGHAGRLTTTEYQTKVFRVWKGE